MVDILFILGSESDRERMQIAFDLAEEKGLSWDCRIYSAHRNLKELIAFLEETRGTFRSVIAAAGLSAALPGVVASLTDVPVLGVPLEVGSLSGLDALLSILQLPKGTPVATMGIGKQGILNAVHLAERIVRNPAGIGSHRE